MKLPLLISPSVHPSEAVNMRAIVLMCLLHAAFAGHPYVWLPLGHPTPNPHPEAGGDCKTGQGACGCCVMVQEVNRLTTYINESLNKLEMETIQTKQRLNDTQASRSAFSGALHNEDKMTCFGPFSNDALIVYKHVFINLANGYSVETGIFTVPHSGVYSLALTVYSDAGAPGNTLAACASLQVNGRVLVGSRDKNKKDQEDSATIVVAVNLTAGDQVAVNMSTGCFLCDDSNHYNTFSAFLLYPAV